MALPYSETFVYDQLQHQSRFRAQVFARGRSRYAERFPYPQVCVLSAAQSALLYGPAPHRASRASCAS